MRINTNTPLQRVGLILLLLSLVSFLLLSAYWNIAESSFVRVVNVIAPIESDKPNDTEGSFWFRSGNAWFQIDKNCNNGESAQEIEGRSFIPVDCIVSEQKDEYRVIGERLDFSPFGDFVDFLIEKNMALWLALSLAVGVFCFSGFTDEAISLFKKVYTWIKTGNWDKKSKNKKERRFAPVSLSSYSKKIIYGGGVLALWLFTEVILKNSGIVIGGIPYGLLIFFWLWLFCKAIGRTVWGFKKLSHVEPDRG